VNKKRSIVVAVLAFMMLFGVSTAMAYVSHTIHQYNGTCSKLTGFPLMLQRFNFVSAGDCQLKADGKTCANSSNCTISNPPTGGSNTGQCTQVKTNGQPDGCVCNGKGK
jgi:hypothetical protein